MWEQWDCSGDWTDLWAQIQIWDAAGHEILAPSDMKPINDNDHGGSYTSALENPLVVTGEHINDYVQFTLGGESWTSRDADETSNAYCYGGDGGWDPREGPIIDPFSGDCSQSVSVFHVAY
jgi:hypothetical protein